MPTQPAVLGSARLNNFRLNYLTADQTAQRPARVRIILGGVDISAPTSPTRVLYNSITIRDLVFDTPNTCNLTFYGAAPTLGQRLEIWVNSETPALLFGGELQTVARTYKGRPSTVLHPCTAIDDTAGANRRRPLGLWTNTSATTIAQWLVSTFAYWGYSSAGVEANLPAVTINFDGSEGGMKGCLTALAKLIGGYWYFENKTLYLFITPPGPSPDPIDDTPGRFLHDPPITWTVDKSQVRTRVYGKGAGSTLAATVNPTVTIVPVESVAPFWPIGGRVIAAVTPDGAASRILQYTGTQPGGGGGLVGPGAAPSAAPGLANLDGAGIESGVHKYALTFSTATGESLPSPAAAITVGVTAPPAIAPTPGSPTIGGAVDAGTHFYAVTFVTASGETTTPGVTQSVETYVAPSTVAVTPPAGAPSNAALNGTYTPGWLVGDTITYRVTFRTPTGETTPSPLSAGVVGSETVPPNPLYLKANQVGLPVSADPTVTSRRLYRYRNGVLVGARDMPGNVSTSFVDYSTVASPGVGPPATNTATAPGPGVAYQTVPLTGIATGAANVTARRLYRYSGAGPYKLLATIANNTATTYTDTTASSALGATLPATNTAASNQVRVTLALGGSGTTGRKVYRSTANTDPLKLLTTIADNTTAAITDAAADATLGAAAPVVDTSGLKQPEGQAVPGATSIVVANTSAFVAGGGWAIVGNGEQTIRYSGITASSLTGIPATGVGSLTAAVSYNSTITAAPALVGVTGILETMLQGAPLFVWTFRDDWAAQTYMAALDGNGDGVYEHIVSDERRQELALVQVCLAELALYSRPLVTVTYATRDTKTKSGKTVQIALASPAIAETLVIQDVAISDIGIAPTLKPKYTVTASNVHHSFDAILRQLIRKAGA